MSSKETTYKKRALARVVIEATTPMTLGSGEADIMSDALVATDVNGLPYIPGSSLAGVIRHTVEDKSLVKLFMGYQIKKEGEGSKLIVSEAKILNSKGVPMDGLVDNPFSDSLLKNYDELPVRQHVKINSMGAATKGGKFDQQVIYCGTRFVFEMELLMNAKATDEQWREFINVMSDPEFRLGSGTRNGFGEIKVVEIKTATIDLNNKEDREKYLKKSSNLIDSSNWNGWVVDSIGDAPNNDSWDKYTLKVKPMDFFMFGSGMGDENGDADMTAVTAKKVDWSNNVGVIEDNMTLIPATSVKGALRHRVAFHYNKIKGITADKVDVKKYDLNSNEAVKAIFGYENSKSEDRQQIKRGNAIFSDIICEPLKDKLINHVSIDRFTGGAIDGALFTEKPLYGNGVEYTLTINIKKLVLEEDEDVKQALENALKDICNGMLPLGGGVNRGNGIFYGKIFYNDKEI